MKVKSRKQARKEFRKAKKVKKHEFFSRKKLKNKNFKNSKKNCPETPKEKKPEKIKDVKKGFKESVQSVRPRSNVNEPLKIEKLKGVERGKKRFRNLHEMVDFERRKEKKERETLDREIKEQRIKQLKKDNVKEEMEIKKLEKQLKIHKGKSKAFAVDGLDYLLDVCDKKISASKFETTLRDSDSEFENDLEVVVGTHSGENKRTLTEKQKKIIKKDEESEEEEYSSQEEDEYENSESFESDSFGDDYDDDDEEEFDDFSDSDDDVFSNSGFKVSKVLSTSCEEKEEELNDSEEESGKSEVERAEVYSKSEEEGAEVCSKSDEEIEEEVDEEVEEEVDEEIEEEVNKSDEEIEEEVNNSDEEIEEKASKSEEKIESEGNLSRSSVANSLKAKESSQHKRKHSDECKKTNKKKVKFEKVESDEDETQDDGGTKTEEVTQVWEDIYGRSRDEKGNVVRSYTPPQLREKVDESKSEENKEKLDRLKKQLKGLLNRLAESNMAFISNQVEQLYMSNSRNDMNETLYSLLNDSLFCEVLTPERLITEHALLIAVLHSNIGSEIGAHFLQHSVIEFNNLLQNNPPVENKRINNILLFIMHLYNFQLFHSKLMYDLVDELLKNLEEKQIELLLTTFRTVGFNLRKDDPAALKCLVIKVQEKVNSISSAENSSRMRFMLEMLMAIKNNNMSKIPNYNPEFVEKLKKSLKTLVRKGNYSTELNISLRDLLNAEKQGRWWIVGSAWSGAAPAHPDDVKSKESSSLPGNEYSQKLLELAKKQRMNTDVRRNIFCILMSAEDFMEAFEKVIKLKLKGAVEREVMNVLLHCALQEKNFNPYYVYLANKFCSFDRKYQMMLQCAVWDKIKELPNALPIQVTNLAKFVGNVIYEKGLPLSTLKVIEFSDLDKPSIKFMRQVLLTVLMKEDRDAVAAVFRRIAYSSKLKLFRESLRLFLLHFVLKNTKNIEEEKVSKLVEMAKVAEQALQSSDVQNTF